MAEETIKTTAFENYPFRIIIISNLVTFHIYFLGAFLMYRLGVAALAAYIIYIALLEVRLISGHCAACCYLGKWCAFGRGRLSGIFFKKGEVRKFNKTAMTWKNLIPDMLVMLIPLLAGIIILMFRPFSWAVPLAMLALFVLATTGNGFVRQNLACKYCKQKGLGCPAEALFRKPIALQ